jgi:DNA polymerase
VRARAHFDQGEVGRAAASPDFSECLGAVAMFSADDIGWIDFEVFGGLLNLKAAGTFCYATAASTRAIVLAYAIGGAPAQTWHADGAILEWDYAPDELRTAFERRTPFAAWNAGFDSAIWNYATLGFPLLEPERVIDPMVQAGVSNLPTDLESASRYLGGEGKQKDGKALIRLFCIEGADPRQCPAEWERFLAYARQDIEAMREVYRCTRPLPREEWQQYWAFEHINRRGVPLNMAYVRRAMALAAEDAIAIGHRLAALTNGVVTKVTQAKRIATWMQDMLPDAAMREVLIVGVPVDDDDDDGDDTDPDDPQKLSLERDRVDRVLAMLEAKRANGGLSADEAKAHEAATLRLYGAGNAPKKFACFNAQQVNGVLRGQYRFAGAGQTGRLTSKGAQIQNLTRDVLGKDGAAESPLLEAIENGCNYAALAAAEPADVPVARKLALIVRPAIATEPGKLFVWSDWSMIEARILPWLAASEGSEKALDVFRAHDRDPSLPDSYVIAASDVLHKDLRTVTQPERQVGKVVILSCGFSGSVGALKNMALSYHIHFEDAEARRIVDAWRAANPWAVEFWGAHSNGESNGLWGAAMQAWELPGRITTAGRLAFIYRDDYLGGTLFMALPSGRLLTYPRPRWREVDVLDKDGDPTGEKRTECSIRRAHGRVKFWRGTLCENCVSGTAADILRATVTRIETNPTLEWMPIVMTTHDEIVCEVDAARADEVKAILRREMLTLPDWAEGLPLQSEEQICSRYSKSKATLARRE